MGGAAKNRDACRSQLCPDARRLRSGGEPAQRDFAGHFTVSAATITDANQRRQPEGQYVDHCRRGARSGPTGILFTVVPHAGGWCIATEAPGGNTPSAAATP
jgi:hypothetical protein